MQGMHAKQVQGGAKWHAAATRALCLKTLMVAGKGDGFSESECKNRISK